VTGRPPPGNDRRPTATEAAAGRTEQKSRAGASTVSVPPQRDNGTDALLDRLLMADDVFGGYVGVSMAQAFAERARLLEHVEHGDRAAVRSGLDALRRELHRQVDEAAAAAWRAVA